MEIRGFTVKYSKQKAKVNKDKEKSLQEKINTLQAQTEKHPHNKKLLLELNAEKMRLKRIMNYKTKCAILRSKVRWHEQGERNTKYFYGLEVHKNKTVTRLKTAENAFTSDQFEILEKEKQFYKSLYKPKNVDPSKFEESMFFNPGNISPLTEEDKSVCEGQITMDECLEALKDFQSRKTPGTDGFSAEVYLFFLARNRENLNRQS